MSARPKLGQHFLRADPVLTRIAAAAVEPGDTVLEIGPGQGDLTRFLLRSAQRVVAVELDPELAGSLPERCANSTNLEVVCADVLDFSLPGRMVQVPKVQSVITGNLPYYITSPILRAVFASRNRFRAATFLMQEEVADRVVAVQGSPPYSFLSCLCRLHSEPRKLFAVPPEAFSPPPRVRSAVVQFALFDGEAPAGLEDFLGACFRRPRKTLLNNLTALYGRDLVASDPCAGLRAQQMGVSELEAMWRRLESARSQ